MLLAKVAEGLHHLAILRIWEGGTAAIGNAGVMAAGTAAAN